MPYTIRIAADANFTEVLAKLTALTPEYRFRADTVLVTVRKVEYRDIQLTHIRLVEAKPYCGQHPGECALGGPKRRGKWLEWDNWVAFNGLVNDALDALGVSADVWSRPPERMDVGRKMWVRRGVRRRYQYDWYTDYIGGREVRVWNHGSDDQFMAVSL